MCVEGTLGQELHEGGERAGRDLLAPVLLSDPIADKALTLLGPAPDVARHRAGDPNRLRERRGGAEDGFRPVRVERCTVARGEGGHARGVGVELVVEEEREVVGLDVTESYFVAHFSVPA